MADRYRMARATSAAAYCAAVKEDTELLSQFGLQLLSADSGVRAAIESEVAKGVVNAWNIVAIDTKTWDWLRPLLIELKAARIESDRLVAK